MGVYLWPSAAVGVCCRCGVPLVTKVDKDMESLAEYADGQRCNIWWDVLRYMYRYESVLENIDRIDTEMYRESMFDVNLG